MATSNQIGLGLSGSSGTGNFAGTTSPTLTTPRIAQINDTSGNAALAFQASGSANYWQFTNAPALGSITLSAIGSDSAIDASINTKGTGKLTISTGALTQPLIIYSGTSSQHGSTFNFSNTAAVRNYTFPDASGTILISGQAVSTIKTFKYTSNATYTPTSGTVGVMIEMCGAGGGGGGSQNATVGASGGAGGYIKQYLTAAEIGASLALVVPSGGAGGGTNAAGTAGSATTVSTPSNVIVLTANGGSAGSGGTSSTSGNITGVSGGTASVSSGSVTYTGIYQSGGGSSTALTNGDNCSGSLPGANPLSSIPRGIWGGGATMDVATGYGGGGGGAFSNSTGGNRSGVAGGSGVVFITEYS